MPYPAIATQIIVERKGQLTTEQRRKLHEQRRKEIVSIISRNAVNPQTNAPHPPQRIENAMEEAKVQVDLFRPAKDQLPGILKEIRKLIPISMEEISLAAKISPEFAGKAEFAMHKYGIKKQEWQKDGSLIMITRRNRKPIIIKSFFLSLFIEIQQIYILKRDTSCLIKMLTVSTCFSAQFEAHHFSETA